MPFFRDRKDEPQESEPEQAPDYVPPPFGPDLLLGDGPLLAPWFMAYRLREEIERSLRYGCPLSILVAEVQLLAHESLVGPGREAAALAAKKAARNTDLVGWLDDRRIITVLCETDAASGRFAAARFRDEMWLLTHTHGGQKWAIALVDDIEAIAALAGDEERHGDADSQAA